jgi:hypothetical protein
MVKAVWIYPWWKYKGGEGVSLPDCGNGEAVWIYPWWKYIGGE